MALTGPHPLCNYGFSVHKLKEKLEIFTPDAHVTKSLLQCLIIFGAAENSERSILGKSDMFLLDSRCFFVLLLLPLSSFLVVVVCSKT